MADKFVTIKADTFAYILKCMNDQKHIHELDPTLQESYQNIIDDAYKMGIRKLKGAK